MKLFSVIVACYNNSEYLEQCLDSILCQDYPAMELVVCDDGSKAFDIEYFKNYIEQHRQSNLVSYEVYTNEINLGTVKNLNIALSKCHGDYYKDIAADDMLYNSRVLTNVAEDLDKSSNGIIVCDVMNCDVNMQPLRKWRNNFISSMESRTFGQNFSMLTVRNYISAGGIFFTKQFWDKFGPYDERFRLLEDWPMWLKVFASGAKIQYCPKLVVKYRQTGGVVASSNKFYLQDRAKVFRIAIAPNKHLLSAWQYCKAYVASFLATNWLVRKIYYLFR